MKIQSLILSIFLIGNGTVSNAKALSKNEPINRTAVAGYLKKITPEFIYGYIDFNFNSTSGENFNKYNGHANLYSTGADHISLGKTLMMGVYYFGISTTVSSQFLLTPGYITTSAQTIENNTIFGHILKIFTPEIFADVGGGYGYNKLSAITQIETTPTPIIGQANNNNDNWFTTFNAIYRKLWKKYLLRANLGVLYSEIDSGSYNYFFPATSTYQEVQPLVNKATLILEHVELGYFVNSKLMPFISGGLIQVAQFSNSRPVLNPANEINGALPQFNMNKSGFRVGGGLVYAHKNVTIRVEEKYFNAGGTFQSYLTLAALEYRFG